MKVIENYKEFVRRLLLSIRRYDSYFAMFLGHNCSKSSGIPTIQELTMAYLDILYDLNVGDEGVISFQEWRINKYNDFERENIEKIFHEIFNEVFLFESEKLIEIDNLVADKEPPLSYKRLAKLSLENHFGKHIGFIVIKHYEKLLEKAYMLDNKSQNIIYLNEDFKYIFELPVIARIQGDYNTFSKNHRDTCSSEFILEILKNKFQQINIIFLGYEGNDKCIVDSFKQSREVFDKVYWVNTELPASMEMNDWLNDVGAIWVKHSDFEELMEYMELKFKEAELSENIPFDIVDRAILNIGYVGSGNSCNIRKELGNFFEYKRKKILNLEDLKEIALIIHKNSDHEFAFEMILHRLKKEINIIKRKKTGEETAFA